MWRWDHFRESCSFGAPMQGSRDLPCPLSLSLVSVFILSWCSCAAKHPWTLTVTPSKLGACCMSLVPGLKLEFGNRSAQLEKALQWLCWSSPSEGHAGAARNAAPPPSKAPSGYPKLYPSSPGTKPAIPRLNTHIRAEYSALAPRTNASCCSDTQITPPRGDRVPWKQRSCKPLMILPDCS